MRALRVAVPVLVAVGFFVGDVVDQPIAEAVPVAADVDTLSVAGVDPAAERAQGEASVPLEIVDSVIQGADPGEATVDDTEPEILTSPMVTDDFSVVGVTWDADSVPSADTIVSVRIREAGTWTMWQVLEPIDGAPDPGTEDAVNSAGIAATEPIITTDADAVQVRMDTVSGDTPTDVEAVVIDPGTSPADDPAARNGAARSSAQAAAAVPAIITRAQWGADEGRRSCTNTTMSSLKAAVVHHTAGSNNYSRGDSAGLIRGIYAYHTGTLGWCDVGYNFLVDRYGQVFEGRGGGVTQAVRGAHAGGFNEGTFGISAMGNFDTIGAPDVMVDAIAGVVAWKLQGSYRDPAGTTSLTSAGGGTARYAAGTTVTLPVVMGHRDVGSTACPGANLYAKLGYIRQRAIDLIGAGLVGPALSSVSQPAGGTFRATAGAIGDQTWRFSVLDPCTGAVLTDQSGTAARSRPIDVTWDGRRRDGATAPPGTYQVSLSSASSGTGAPALSRTWSVNVTGSSVTPPVTTGGGAPQPGLFMPIAPTRVLDTRESTGPLGAGETRSVVVTGSGGVPTSGVSAVALNVTSTCSAGTPTSYLTVWPAGESRPGTSSLNTSSADTSAAHVVSAVGVGGAVNVYNDTGSTQLIVDVVGYYTSTGAGARYVQVDPRRVFDSRSDGGLLTSGAERVVDLSGQAGTPPTGMSGAILNVTVAGSQGQGYVTVFPTGQQRPATSTVNLVPGADVANRTAVGLVNNQFTVYAAGGPTHVVVDLVGYYATGGAGSTYHPMTPARLVDTRSGQGGVEGPLQEGGEASVRVAGVAGVPGDARAVVLTVTGDQTSSVTFATVWPGAAARPNTSDLNLRPGRTRANTVVASVGTDGTVRLYNDRGTTQLIVDVVGYYR